MVTEDLIARRGAVVHGAASADLPSTVVTDQLVTGEPAELLPDDSRRVGMSPAAQTLLDFLAERIRAADDWRVSRLT